MSRAIEIVRAVGVALVEDGGRIHRLRHAIPRGGALDPEGLALANVAVGNAIGAAAIERYGALTVRAIDDVVLADDRGAITVLERGASATLGWDGTRRVGYVAIDGGIEVAPFLGGLGTILSLARGGHEGRPLRRGDVLSLGAPSARGERRALSIGDAIHVTMGPDLDRLAPGAAEQFLATQWTLDVRSDRMGTRLVGPALPHRDGTRAVTMPMIEGAIECPPDGPPIVLGPEHPTTGGYPLLAVIARGDLARFHRIPLGGSVRFAL